jgi:hypothetical protein
MRVGLYGTFPQLFPRLPRHKHMHDVVMAGLYDTCPLPQRGSARVGV